MNWQCWQVPVVQQQWQLGLICQSGWTSHAASVPHQPPSDFKNKKGIFLKDIHSNLVCSICDICKFTLSYLHINFLKSLKCSMNLSDIYNLKLTNKYINSMNTLSYGDKNWILTNDMLFDTILLTSISSIDPSKYFRTCCRISNLFCSDRGSYDTILRFVCKDHI